MLCPVSCGHESFNARSNFGPCFLRGNLCCLALLKLEVIFAPRQNLKIGLMSAINLREMKQAQIGTMIMVYRGVDFLAL